MKESKRFAAMVRLAVPVCLLAIGGFGCDQSASPDPVTRAKTEEDAKIAMASFSTKRTAGVSPQQSTRSAMEAARQQKRGGRRTP
jgi:hypothetical protein